MLKTLFILFKNMIMGFAWGIVLVVLLYTCAKRAFGAELEIHVQRGSGTGYGRSINSQHYNPLDVNEFTADVYQYMYHEIIPREPRREDRTHRNVFDDDDYEIEIGDGND